MSRDVSESVTEPNQFWSWLHTHAGGLGYRSESRLARALDVSPTTVMRWKRGAKPSIEQLLKISDVLGVRLEPLLVLSELVPAEAIGNPDMPASPSPVTPGERLIIESGLHPDLQDVLSRYWKLRLAEERTRVERLIEMMKLDFEATRSKDSPSFEVIPKILHTDMAQHVSAAVMEWVACQSYIHVSSRPHRKPLSRSKFINEMYAQARESIVIKEDEDGKFYVFFQGSDEDEGLRSTKFATAEEAEAQRDHLLSHLLRVTKSPLLNDRDAHDRQDS